MKNSQKGFTNIILIAVVVILAGALGYVTLVKKPTPAEQQRQTGIAENKQDTSKLVTESTNMALSPEKLADWKQYINNRYGFTLKFNSSWKISYFKNLSLLIPKSSGTEISNAENANEISVQGDGCMCNIRVEESPRTSLEDWIKQVESPSNISSVIVNKKIEIGGQPAYDITSSLPGFYRRTVFFVRDLDQSVTLKFTIHFDYNHEKIIETPEFDSMLATFKFYPR